MCLNKDKKLSKFSRVLATLLKESFYWKIEPMFLFPRKSSEIQNYSKVFFFPETLLDHHLFTLNLCLKRLVHTVLELANHTSNNKVTFSI